MGPRCSIRFNLRTEYWLDIGFVFLFLPLQRSKGEYSGRGYTGGLSVIVVWMFQTGTALAQFGRLIDTVFPLVSVRGPGADGFFCPNRSCLT